MSFEMVPHYNSLKDAIVNIFGTTAVIKDIRNIVGGDINRTYCLLLQSGECIFMKTNTKQRMPIFISEAIGLLAIAATKTIGVPTILCTGIDNENSEYSFLLLDYIESGKKRSDYFEVLANDLAAMHNTDTALLTKGKKFGFICDNFIGTQVQKNSLSNSWISFFREQRLLPQFVAAKHYFSDKEQKQNSKLLDNLEKFLIEPERPSLIHGDLWSGNVIPSREGRAILIDPAVYVGHYEADIAMTQLFGGFPPTFYGAYCEAMVLQDGYEERRDIYNLYHLLNHLNIFGSSYLESVKNIVSRYMG